MGVVGLGVENGLPLFTVCSCSEGLEF